MSNSEEAARRLRTSLDLYALAESMVRRRLERTRPDADVEAEVLRWVLDRSCAPSGDAEGKNVEWPRR